MTGETQAQSKGANEDVPWKALSEISEPGAYVCRGSGDLMRVPRVGGSVGDEELAEKNDREPIEVTQISRDPFIPISKARIAAANLDVEISF